MRKRRGPERRLRLLEDAISRALPRRLPVTPDERRRWPGQLAAYLDEPPSSFTSALSPPIAYSRALELTPLSRAGSGQAAKRARFEIRWHEKVVVS